MFVEFQFPQDGVEGDVQAFDEEGNEVQVSRVVYTPYFFKPSSVPVVLYTSLFAGDPDDKRQDDKVAGQRSVLTASGTNARVKFQDRTGHVTPLCEDPNPPKKPGPAKKSGSSKKPKEASSGTTSGESGSS